MCPMWMYLSIYTLYMVFPFAFMTQSAGLKWHVAIYVIYMAISILYPYTKSNKTTIEQTLVFGVFGQKCFNFLPLRATQKQK